MNFFHLFSAFLLALFLTSCSTTADTKKIDLREFSNDDEQYALTETREFTAQFCQSVKDGNFSHWQQVMPLNTQKKVTPEIFARMRKELIDNFGTLENFDFLGTLRKDTLLDYLWKLQFVKDGKKRDVIFLVRVFCENQRKPEISGFGIKRF